MSYRAFKRLLGETSLERKCLFLFGGFIILLITASFWVYGWQTEGLAYDQIKTTCRLLVVPILAQQNPNGPPREALRGFRDAWMKDLPESLPNFQYRFLTQDASGPDACDNYELELFRKF